MLWYCEGYQGIRRKERVLPNGRFQLVISLAENLLPAPADPMGAGGELTPALVIGIRSRYSIIDTAKVQPALRRNYLPKGRDLCRENRALRKWRGRRDSNPRPLP
jgi:hypothetical protein